MLRGVAAAGALDRVALYTGNDDHILLDLMLPFDLRDNGVTTRDYFQGGLLGHWSVWTAAAIKQFETLQGRARQDTVPADLLALDARVTDCNAPSSTSPTISTAASPAATKSCAGRACCRASGASIRPKG